jgi:hypothetical protein
MYVVLHSDVKCHVLIIFNRDRVFHMCLDNLMLYIRRAIHFTVGTTRHFKQIPRGYDLKPLACFDSKLIISTNTLGIKHRNQRT